MQGGVVELSRQAAAAARAERRARGGGAARARRAPVRSLFPYRGVQKRGDVYVAQILDAAGLRPVLLGSFATAEEAAYAYDDTERIMRGNKAKLNFPERPAAPAPGGLGGGAPPAARARVLQMVGHARMRAAPVGGGAQRQAFSQLLYRPAAGPALGFAGGSNGGAGFHGPALAAAGGGNGAGFYALISSDKKNKAIVHAMAAADPKLVIIIESDDKAVVEDNFNLVDGGASTSSAPRPAVPPLRLKDLMESEIVRRIADERAP